MTLQPLQSFVAPDIEKALSDGYSIQYQDGVLGTKIFTGWKLVGSKAVVNVPMHEEWQAWFWLPKTYWTVVVEYNSAKYDLLDMPSPVTYIRETWESIKKGEVA